MRTFHSLIQRIEEWRLKLQQQFPFDCWKQADSSTSLTQSRKKIQISQISTMAETKIKVQESCSKNPIHQVHPPVMLLLAIVSLTSIVGNRFYNQPQLDVGTISPQTIRAPYNGRFEDTKTTEEKRKQIRTGIVPTLKRDIEITAQLEQELAELLNQLEQLRELAGILPFVDKNILSLSSQKYLRQCREREWLQIINVVENEQELNLSEEEINLSEDEKQQIRQAITEIKTYNQQNPNSGYKLLSQIAFAREAYAKALDKFSEEPITSPNHQHQILLLNLDEDSWRETNNAIVQTAERVLTQGIPPGLPSKMIKEAVEIQFNASALPSTRVLATALLGDILKANLIEDKEETKRKAEQTAQAIAPVIVSIQQGEVIVEVGETISQEDFVLLDGFDLSRREINWVGLGISGILVVGAIGIFWLVGLRVHRPVRRRDHILLCLLSLTTPLLAIFNIPYTNLPAIGLLVSSFYSPILAVTQVSLLTGLVSFSSGGIGWEYLLAGTSGGILSALMAGRLRSREELALLGGAVGLTQGAVHLIINLILSAAAGTIWYAVLPGSIIYGLSGLAWCIVALGISPYLERLFDLVTPIRLAELSNPNRPLLKRLAVEAPGTFQHTMFVSSLAEAAARELHCNVELVRAGTLYHDIGKMHDPLGFIENQMGGPNKHDQINDPWKSAEIIKKHVSEGLVMARKYNLPKAIRDFIPEHQGTLLISYFYFQAKQKEEELEIEVLEENFRYDGPIPQSREAGIMMLADGCEAALRSLKDATPETALSMVHKIFKARWRDNQLVDSGLRREELPIIAKVFIQVWQQSNHQRIAYPKAALEPQQSR